MNCPQCGEVCHCLPELPPTASASWMPHAARRDESTSSLPSLRTVGPENEAPVGEGAVWRDELSARLDRYRARRKPRPPRYPSLRLRFDAPSRSAAAGFNSTSAPKFETASNRALALDGLAEVSSIPAHDEVPPSQRSPAPAASAATRLPSPPHTHSAASAAKVVVGKILEFPRFVPPTTSPDELAEAVIDRPRILEAPELTPPPPALGGITIEAAQQAEVEKRPGIDIPLQAAPLARRVIAAGADALIVAAASVLSGVIFWRVVGLRPPHGQILGLAGGVPCALWAAYQYLLLVYSAGTPGLRLAGLELVRFDGSPTNRSQRRWRVFASYLSAISLALGYAWVFLDEDALCWHDRITHTFLAPKHREAAHSHTYSA
jgi:uncharacterized RDD family membrane protein YckC